MSKALKLYIAGLVVVSVIALIGTRLWFGVASRIALEFDGHPGASDTEILAGLLFWIVVTLFASALPVKMPGGLLVAVSIAPCIAAMNLGGPAAGAIVAAIGTTELREIRGKIPWFGTLANHAGIIIPAAVGGVVMEMLGRSSGILVVEFLASLVGSAIYFALNISLVSTLVALRTGEPVLALLSGGFRSIAANLLALAPLAWLMSRMYALPGAGWWATLL